MSAQSEPTWPRGSWTERNARDLLLGPYREAALVLLNNGPRRAARAWNDPADERLLPAWMLELAQLYLERCSRDEPFQDVVALGKQMLAWCNREPDVRWPALKTTLELSTTVSLLDPENWKGVRELVQGGAP